MSFISPSSSDPSKLTFNRSTDDLLKQQTKDDITAVNIALLPMLALGGIGVIWVGVNSTVAGAVGAVVLWAIASLAVGGVTGFLFGIPRSGIFLTRTSTKPASVAGGNAKSVAADISAMSSQSSDRSARPNTNLEEISDWLTKIIVGLGLVNLKAIGTRIHDIAANVAASLQQAPTAWDISVAMAMIVGFSIIGFLCGYLYTRLYLQGAMIRSDNNMAGQLRAEIDAAIQEAPPLPDVTPGMPSIPTESDKETARRLNQIASAADRPEVVLEQIRTLASEYESVRQQQNYGSARTKKMREIAGRMKLIGLMVQPFLSKLTASPSPGERLVAIMALQMRFDPTYIEWLANRLVEEPAFPAYQAASALLARLPLVGHAECERIKRAAQAAVAEHKRLNLASEKTRDDLFEKILGFGSPLTRT
ncbi:hypothetical protein [Paraburkholderia sp. J11-2]|uniref:hypothetical protein n=1 Tax=Paraburkholderia sp. J11-2 TaxID=2805431 RepID=UPI002AB6CE06|nr:hypothetical protein [Paraburkholderia sp. J11-2]